MPKNYVLRHRVNSLSSPTLEAGTKFFSLSGKPVTFKKDSVLSASQGSYTLTGQNASLSTSTGLDSQAGDEAFLDAFSTAVTGLDATWNTPISLSGGSTPTGVSSSNATGEYRVTEINLYDSGISGNINVTEWQNLKQCTKVELRRNTIGGNLPAEIGNMTNLQSLILNSTREDEYVVSQDRHPGKPYYSGGTNDFTGTLPPEWGNLSSLQYLVLDWCDNLTGTIPAQWGNMGELLLLHLNYNPQLEGPIPSELGNLTKIVNFGIGYDGNPDSGYTGFAGTSIPSSLGSITTLKYLRLKSLDLIGDASMFSSSTSLTNVFLEFNEFDGPFPDYFNNGNFNDLLTLYLSSNNFNDTLPDLSNLTGLVEFQVNTCILSGSIPDITQFWRITNLTMGWNDLSGELPQTGWGTFSNNLRHFRFNDNNASGHIPSAMVNSMAGNSMQSIRLTNNEFESMDAENINDISNGTLYVDGNRLTPKDIVPLIGRASGFEYGSQGSFDTAETISAGTIIDFSEYDYTNNSYSWLRSTDGGSTFSTISGETTTSYDTTGEASGNIIRMEIDHPSVSQTFESRDKTIA